MRYLIDTNIFLWWLNDDKSLTSTTHEILRNPSNHILVSVISGWEMSIKKKLGKLSLRVTLEECFTQADFEVLPVTLHHILAVDKLPSLHKDPFDRLLAAQSQVEKCTLLTSDRNLLQYPISAMLN